MYWGPGLLLASSFLAGGVHCLIAMELPYRLVSYHGDCQVDMPTAPQRMSESVVRPEQGLDLEYEAYLSEGEPQELFMLLIASYAGGIDPVYPEANLEGFLNGMLGYHGDTALEHADYETFAGHRAVAFRMRNGTRTFHGHALIDQHRLYLLALEVPSHRASFARYEHFASTFMLLTR